MVLSWGLMMQSCSDPIVLGHQINSPKVTEATKVCPCHIWVGGLVVLGIKTGAYKACVSSLSYIISSQMIIIYTLMSHTRVHWSYLLSIFPLYKNLLQNIIHFFGAVSCFQYFAIKYNIHWQLQTFFYSWKINI